jgi:hypothetical protein
MFLEDDTKSKLPAFVCKADADTRSDNNISTFLDYQIAITYQIAEMAKDAYFCKDVYVNFRKTKAVIKLNRVDGPVTIEAVHKLKEFAALHGFKSMYIAKSHSIKFDAARA